MTPRAPALVLVSGLICVAVGLGMLAVAARVDGLIWYAVPVAALGLVLIGMWVRDRRRPDPPPDTPESIAANLPGRWYPVAILVIAAALMAWFAYWTKHR